MFTSPHPCLARFLQRAIVALAIACSACLWPASANAQQLGVKSPGWDYLDPVNIAESRVYARLFFEFKDTGVMSPEFQNFRFTNPAPTGVMTPFYGAEVVFEKIYAHRLAQFDRVTRMSYTLSDLRRDDPAVEAAFRLYATTGKLATPLSGDTDVLINHLQAIGDAVVGNNKFTFTEFEYTLTDGQPFSIADDKLESIGLITVASESTLDALSTSVFVSQNNISVSTIKRNLPDMPNGPVPYWPDGQRPCKPGEVDNGPITTDGYCLDPDHPGFDCDDYARAWAAWLKRHLAGDYPNAKYYVIYVYYGNPLRGHAVVAILIDGYYYLLDPQSGKIVGPIKDGWFWDPDFKPALKELLVVPGYCTPDEDIDGYKIHPPDYINPNEPRPWYEDPDVLEWWKKKFPGQDPNDYIW